MNKLITTMLLIVSTSSFAEMVPALNNTAPASIFNSDIPLNSQQKYGLNLASKWINGKSKPITNGDGSVTYFYGAVMPHVVCAPLKPCDIQLQEGERINKDGVNIGDSVRWRITPAISGEGGNEVTHLIVKPTDVGLNTSLILTTNKRTYNISLTSHSKKWMPTVNFDYPEEMNKEWNNYYAQVQQQVKENTLGNGLNINDLDFNYDILGHAPFKPVRVYNNGIKTIIDMPKSVNSSELPSLLVVNSGNKELVNYRYVNGKFIVDQIAKEMVLILGVGMKQQSIIIKYKG
ncbi:P-type conjugative transfer protein TrbG [Photobacterium damselae]|uniref:P-type conjugative transfer protein TrbG n=1 Tax=Photobacterium damselae TaxID=38293 RepID=UPI00254368D8